MTNERRDYFPPDEIVGEVKVSIESHEPGEIDWITFAGSGEPTLHVSLGRMTEQIKGLTDIPVAVITNGALLYQPEVRKDLIQADAVLPSLDAGSEALYRKINRPWPELTFERLVSGLTTFRREYTGKLWIEVMLIKGVNDTEPALKDLARVINGIGPDEVHLNLPIRPPSEPWVNPSGEEGLARARTMLGGVAKVVPPAGGVFDLSTYDDVMDAVIGVITRHPMLEEEILQTLKRWTPGQVEDALVRLSESGKAKVVSRYGKRFWSFTGAKYA